MMHTRIAAIDKEMLLIAHEGGDDYFALADNLGIKRRTDHGNDGIVRSVEEKGGVVELPRGGCRPLKVDDDRHQLEVSLR